MWASDTKWVSVDNTHTSQTGQRGTSLCGQTAVLMGVAAKLTATETSGHVGRETADSGGQTEHTATHQDTVGSQWTKGQRCYPSQQCGACMGLGGHACCLHHYYLTYFILQSITLKYTTIEYYYVSTSVHMCVTLHYRACPDSDCIEFEKDTQTSPKERPSLTTTSVVPVVWRPSGVMRTSKESSGGAGGRMLLAFQKS